MNPERLGALAKHSREAAANNTSQENQAGGAVGGQAPEAEGLEKLDLVKLGTSARAARLWALRRYLPTVDLKLVATVVVMVLLAGANPDDIILAIAGYLAPLILVVVYVFVAVTRAGVKSAKWASNKLSSKRKSKKNKYPPMATGTVLAESASKSVLRPSFDGSRSKNSSANKNSESDSTPNPSPATVEGGGTMQVTRPSAVSNSLRPDALKTARRHPLHISVALYLENSLLGFLYEFLMLLFALYSCGAYLYLSYEPLDDPDSTDENVSRALVQIELWVSVAIAFDWVLQLFLAEHKSSYITDLYAYLDLITFIPAVAAIVAPDRIVYSPTLLFLRSVRLFRGLDRVRGNSWNTSLNDQIGQLLLGTAVFIFCSAGAILVVESSDPQAKISSILDSLYFVIVTISTVGYGDLSVDTEFGKVLMMVFIIVVLALVPTQTSKIIELFDAYTAAGGSFKPHSRKKHIIVLSDAGLKDFLVEYYHEDRSENHHRAVVLTHAKAGPEFQRFLRQPYWNGRIQLLQGGGTTHRDMERISVYSADSAFIMSNNAAPDPEVEDADVVLRVLAFRSANPSLPLYVQINNPQSKHHVLTALQDNGLVICVTELKMAILAQNALTPGFTALINNIIRSVSEAQYSSSDPQWIREYSSGVGVELYAVSLSAAFTGLRFKDAAVALAQLASVTLLGLELPADPRPVISINPSNHVLVEGMIAFVLAHNEDAALTAINQSQEALDAAAAFCTDPMLRCDKGRALRSVPGRHSPTKAAAAVNASPTDPLNNGAPLQNRPSAVAHPTQSGVIPTLVPDDSGIQAALDGVQRPRLSPSHLRKTASTSALLAASAGGGERLGAPPHTNQGKATASVTDIHAASSTGLLPSRNANSTLPGSGVGGGGSGLGGVGGSGTKKAATRHHGLASLTAFDAAYLRSNGLTPRDGNRSPSFRSATAQSAGPFHPRHSVPTGNDSPPPPAPTLGASTPDWVPFDHPESPQDSDDLSTMMVDFAQRCLNLKKRRVTIEDATVVELPLSVKSHIIVTGTKLTGIYYFILRLRLRSRYPDDLNPPIVLLTSEEIPPSIWHRLALFPNVYVIKGSALDQGDLWRSGVTRARTVVILPFSTTFAGELGERYSDPDAPTILAHRNITSAAPWVPVMSELLDTSAVRFMQPVSALYLQHQALTSGLPSISSLTRHASAGAFGPATPKPTPAAPGSILSRTPSIDSTHHHHHHHGSHPQSRRSSTSSEKSDATRPPPNSHGLFGLSEFLAQPATAAGSVIATSMLNTLLAQSYYNPYMPQLIERMVMGSTLEGSEQTHVVQLKVRAVASHLIGHTYLELFAYLLRAHGILCIGLYRTNISSRFVPYVYNNPSLNTVIAASDAVFAFMPALLGDDDDELVSAASVLTMVGVAEAENKTKAGLQVKSTPRGTSGSFGAGSQPRRQDERDLDEQPVSPTLQVEPDTRE